MLVHRRVMTWTRVAKSLHALVAHGLLFSFTLLIVLKLHHTVSFPWWIVFSPLWLFHAVVARARFSIPAPSLPHGRHWAPFHAVMATPLLVAFEILLCIYLQDNYVVKLKIVFAPLLAFEAAILFDNIRMCKALMPGDDETMSDDVIWETLPHFWVSISMVFFIAATIFTLLKICGDVAALGWWDLFINFGIAEGFACLVCTKWYNPAIHRHSHIRESCSSSMNVRYLDWNRGLVFSSDEDQQQSGICDLQDIGGHVIKVPLIIFQILLFIHLEGKPSGARTLSIPVVCSPLFLLQGAGVLFATYRLVEKILLLLHSGVDSGRYLGIASKVQDCFGFLHRGSRLLGWWSIDEGSREEQAKIYCDGASGSVAKIVDIHYHLSEKDRLFFFYWYNTFSPDTVKKMPKSDLVQEIWRLQAALSEQTEVTKYSQQEYERLQNEKILCRVCFEEQIDVVLLPCRHHILCRTCCEKCKKCPICRVAIEARLPVYDV